jgi:Phosphotransferase enzyme family
MVAVGSQQGEEDEGVLREYLQQILPDVCGRASRIVDIGRRRSEFSSSYDCDILTVQLADGAQVPVFLKNLGFSHIPKDQARWRRERELRIYRELLGSLEAQAQLGTARYYGCVWDETAGRYWLLLEHVPGMEVRYCDFAYWLGAVRWLGRMQGYFAQHATQLGGCDYLLRHDANFFLASAELAIAAGRHFPPALADRLTHILQTYIGLMKVLANQPLTLVHGSFRPQNVLVNPGAGPLRFCPIDWELAALGSPLYDLAVFADGFAPPMLDQLLESYRLGAEEHNVRVGSGEEARCIVDGFRLHKIVKSLGKPRDWKAEESVISDYVIRGEKLAGACTAV